MKFGLPISLNVLAWSFVGMLRLFDLRDIPQASDEKRVLTKKQLKHERHRVAVVLPCYNEALVVGRTIESLKKNVPAQQIFVGADGCTDNTATIARAAGCQVLEVSPGIGKAQMIERLLDQYSLLRKFNYIIMADADAIFSERYVTNALLLFAKDTDIVAIAGYARTPWLHHWLPQWRMYYVGYRVRLIRLLQLVLTYAWTWRRINVNWVVPGFASIYRSAALKQLNIYVPGMVIEDFNLAFQIHKKKLGRIAHHPSIYAIDQDPDNFEDYVRQISRWNIGYWQTLKHNGWQPTRFFLAQTLFIAEVLLFAIMLIGMPLIIMGIVWLNQAHPGDVITIGPVQLYEYQVVIAGSLGGLLVIDYLLTMFVAFRDRRYMLLFYGLGFFVLRVVDSIILLATIPEGFKPLHASGRWLPPTRYQRLED